MRKKTGVHHFAAAVLSALALLAAGCGQQEESITSAPEAPPPPPVPAAPEEAPAESEFSITNITGDLYLAQTRSHGTVFLVTPDGVILADPLRPDFAEWLKTELQSRFGATVEYVLYSHHHPDHAAGGNTFADTAIYVGHEQMAVMLDGPLPSNAVNLDADSNGMLENSEATGQYQANFDSMDTNQDGSLSGVEIHANTHPLDITYSDSMIVTLGDSTVELYHSSPSHSEDMTYLVFPDQRALFGVDYVHVKRLPGNLGGSPVEKHLAALEELNAHEFDIVAQGHGPHGTRADLTRYVQFLKDLESEVTAAFEAGTSLEEAQASIALSDYSDWLLFDQRRENLIREMYSILGGE